MKSIPEDCRWFEYLMFLNYIMWLKTNYSCCSTPPMLLCFDTCVCFPFLIVMVQPIMYALVEELLLYLLCWYNIVFQVLNRHVPGKCID
ncbi:hypothetical protein GDO78_020936 [Eleutherodactylus coqui]|uniref:Uncharacterized protein n=1 Tax=Eleutherodactylus coqui TaxID=57060 RepID=A0A8J6E8I6_ELECQ|nr:hypothetical protein GDO78_020936 [Eleutherodactylus coqui]